MTAYSTVLFDLDGTLTDPGVGIIRSITHALESVEQQVQRELEFGLAVAPANRRITGLVDFGGDHGGKVRQ